MNPNYSFFETTSNQVEKKVSFFIDNLLNEGFEFKAMIDPHQTWLKEKKADISKKNIIYRLQLHLAPPRRIIKEKDLNDEYYSKIMNFIYGNMDSVQGEIIKIF